MSPVRKTTTKKGDSEPAFPITFETFRRPGHWERRSLEHSGPSCFNGIVNVQRYRVTFEEIEDPDEVIVARIEKLWKESTNHHDWDPLRIVAARYGFELRHSPERSLMRKKQMESEK